MIDVLTLVDWRRGHRYLTLPPARLFWSLPQSGLYWKTTLCDPLHGSRPVRNKAAAVAAPCRQDGACCRCWGVGLLLLFKWLLFHKPGCDILSFRLLTTHFFPFPFVSIYLWSGYATHGIASAPIREHLFSKDCPFLLGHR